MILGVMMALKKEEHEIPRRAIVENIVYLS
jgi:hypothetical protein